MKIDIRTSYGRNADSKVTAMLTFHPRNYDPNAFFNMVEKLKGFCNRVVISRRSPIRFQLDCNKRRVLKNIMKELGPESAVLGLSYTIPQSKKIERLHEELINYLETF